MNKLLRKKYFLFLFVLALGYLFIIPPMIGAQQLTHKVEKGETLWSICEKYYGDSDLWPKLWQMNPFITNPHFLNPGDVITLLGKKPVKETPAPVVEAEKNQPKVQPNPCR